MACSFRWLSRKYPKVVSSVIEEDQPAPPPGPDGVQPPVRFDMSKRNPKCAPSQSLKGQNADQVMCG